jgi:hypothetical protein
MDPACTALTQLRRGDFLEQAMTPQNHGHTPSLPSHAFPGLQHHRGNDTVCHVLKRYEHGN